MKTIRECYNVQYLTNMQYVWCMLFDWCSFCVYLNGLWILDCACTTLWCIFCNLYMGIWEMENISVQFDKVSIFMWICVKENHFVSFIIHFHLFKVSENHVLCAIRSFHLAYLAFGIRHSDTDNRQHNESLHLIVF